MWSVRSVSYLFGSQNHTQLPTAIQDSGLDNQRWQGFRHRWSSGVHLGPIWSTRYPFKAAICFLKLWCILKTKVNYRHFAVTFAMEINGTHTTHCHFPYCSISFHTHRGWTQSRTNWDSTSRLLIPLLSQFDPFFIAQRPWIDRQDAAGMSLSMVTKCTAFPRGISRLRHGSMSRGDPPSQFYTLDIVRPCSRCSRETCLKSFEVACFSFFETAESFSCSFFHANASHRTVWMREDTGSARPDRFLVSSGCSPKLICNRITLQ